MHEHDCNCGHHAHETPANNGENQESQTQPEGFSDMWDESRDVPLPDPTLLDLVTGLASQALLSLGVFPNPITGKSTMMMHQGKHLIDTVAMIYEKTAGNQTEEEKQKIDAILHELRMVFVAAQNEKARRESQPAQ